MMKISIILLSVCVCHGLRFQGISSEKDVTDEYLKVSAQGDLPDEDLLQATLPGDKEKYTKAAAKSEKKKARDAAQKIRKDAKDKIKEAKIDSCGKLPDSDIEGHADGCRGAVNAKGLFDNAACTKAGSWYSKCCVVWKKNGLANGATDEVCVSVKEGKELTALHTKAVKVAAEIDALDAGDDKTASAAAWALNCDNPKASVETGWQFGCGGAVDGNGEGDEQLCMGLKKAGRWYARCCEWTTKKFCASVKHNTAQTKEDVKDGKVEAKETAQKKKRADKDTAQAARVLARAEKKAAALAVGDARKRAAINKKAGKKASRAALDLPVEDNALILDNLRCDNPPTAKKCEGAVYPGEGGGVSQDVCEGFPFSAFQWYSRCCTYNAVDKKCEDDALQLSYDVEDTKIRKELLATLNTEACADPVNTPCLAKKTCGEKAVKAQTGELCNQCQACAANADCVQGYVCSTARLGFQNVEGCAGFGEVSTKAAGPFYCHTPAGKKDLQSFDITGDANMRECVGKCTKDSDCEHGLTCFIRNGVANGKLAEVPGCAGLGVSEYNYCYVKQP